MIIFLQFINKRGSMSQENSSNNKFDINPKLFITNLPPSIEEEQLKDEMERLFEVYGRIVHLNVKKNKNGVYSFAFLEFEKSEDAQKAIEGMDQKEIHGRPMKVRQDRQMEGCFNCKREGHFAKECPERSDKPRDTYKRRSPERNYDRKPRRRSRSRSHDKYRRSRSRSYSDDRRYRDYKKSRNYQERSYSRDHDRRRDYDRGYRKERDYDRDRDRDRERERDRDYDRHRHHRRDHYPRSRSYSYER